MTKKEIIELYLADLNNLVPDSDAKRSRVIDLEDELEALRIHDVVGRSEQLVCDHPDEAIIRDKPTDYCLACNSNI